MRGGLRLRRREHGLHSGEGRIQKKEGDSHRNHAGGTEVVGSGNGVALEQEEDFPSAPRGKGSWGGFRSGLGEQLLLRPQ